VKILDLSAGNRAIWFDKNNPLCTFVDKRESVSPDVVCDTRNILPEKVGKDFDLVCWDPPHMNCGPKSQMSKRYGYHTTADILDTIEKTSESVLKVLKPGALMAFKWNDHDIKLERVLALMPKWEPLFGHRLRNMSGISKSNKKRSLSQSYWVMLRVRESS